MTPIVHITLADGSIEECRGATNLEIKDGCIMIMISETEQVGYAAGEWKSFSTALEEEY